MDNFSRSIWVLTEDTEIADQICRPLMIEGYKVQVFHCLSEVLNGLSQSQPQMIIVEPYFKKDNTDIFFDHLSSGEIKSSIVIVSKETNIEKMTQYLDLGANDYITMPFVPVEFLARIRTQFRLQDMKDLLYEVNERLQSLVEIDDLTGLFNMRSLYHKLDYEIERSKRFNRAVTAVMIDIDKFKSVNDGHDHLFGSYVISEVGKIIKSCTRSVDIPARYGGDEFLIILSEIPEAGVKLFCDRLRQSVEERVFSNGIDSISLTVSLGYAITYGESGITPKELVRRADAALYEAKKQGRNRTVGYDSSFDRLSAGVEVTPTVKEIENPSITSSPQAAEALSSGGAVSETLSTEELFTTEAKQDGNVIYADFSKRKRTA